MTAQAVRCLPIPLLVGARAATPVHADVEITDSEIPVRMSWTFRTRFRRSALSRVEPVTSVVLSRGVHGFAGRWLVNGSSRGILTIHLLPVQRGYVMGFPVRLPELSWGLTEITLNATPGFQVETEDAAITIGTKRLHELA